MCKINEYGSRTMAKKKDVDLKLVEDLAALLCTQVEICKIIGITERTLRNRADISDAYKKGQETGKISLRRMQFKLAEKSPAMAIWLGKQYLGQSDKAPVTSENWTTLLKIERLNGSVI